VRLEEALAHADGEEHLVDDVGDSVGGLVVGGDDLGVIDKDGAALVNMHGQVVVVEGGDDLVVVEVRGREVPSDDVVLEDLIEGSHVAKEVREELVREAAEGVVGGGEDGEGARAGERVDEAAGLDGGDEGRELGDGLGELDEVGEGADAGDGVAADALLGLEPGLGLGEEAAGVGEEDGVDHVDDAVAAVDVGDDDGGVAVDEDLAVGDDKDEGLTLDGEDLLEVLDLVGIATALAEVAAGVDDVVGEDVVELLGVLEEVLEDAGGQGVEGLRGGEGGREGGERRVVFR
jgi:hypothetical protein